MRKQTARRGTQTMAQPFILVQTYLPSKTLLFPTSEDVVLSRTQTFACNDGAT